MPNLKFTYLRVNFLDFIIFIDFVYFIYFIISFTLLNNTFCINFS